MARRRNPKATQEVQDVSHEDVDVDVNVQEVQTTSAQSAQTKENNNMSAIENLEELDFDAIDELLAGTRSTGEYGDYLKDFLASGKIGIEVSFDDALMVGKDAEKGKIGFENAKKATVKDTDPPQLKVAGANNVKVVKKNTGTKEAPEWHLFLINTQLASERKNAA